MHLAVILTVVLSLIMGYLGRHRAVGFVGTFLASILFTPVIVGLVLLFTAPSQVAPDSPKKLAS